MQKFLQQKSTLSKINIRGWGRTSLLKLVSAFDRQFLGVPLAPETPCQGVCSAGRSGCQCQHCKDSASSLLQKSVPDYWLISQRAITCALLFLTFEISCFISSAARSAAGSSSFAGVSRLGQPRGGPRAGVPSPGSGGMRCWGWDKGPSPEGWRPGLGAAVKGACRGRRAGEKSGWGLQCWRDPVMTKIPAERGTDKFPC